MPTTLTTIRTKVTGRVRDGASKLDSTNLDVAIAGALAEYQRARPREVSVVVDGAGTFDYTVSSALTAFVEGLSQIREIVYPYDATEQAPTALERDQWALVRVNGTLKLRFLSATPTASEDFHVAYTAPHTLDANGSTVWAADEEALADLAASYACEALAGHYQQTSESSLSADSVERRSIADGYRSQAARWRKAYEAKMGAEAADGPAAAVVTVPGRLSTPWSERRFFHDRRAL